MWKYNVRLYEICEKNMKQIKTWNLNLNRKKRKISEIIINEKNYHEKIKYKTHISGEKTHEFKFQINVVFLNLGFYSGE